MFEFFFWPDSLIGLFSGCEKDGWFGLMGYDKRKYRFCSYAVYIAIHSYRGPFPLNYHLFNSHKTVTTNGTKTGYTKHLWTKCFLWLINPASNQ